MPVHEDLIQETIDCFWESVPPTWRRIRERIRASATENFGITVEQFHILRHIRKGLHTVSELAEERMITRPAVSQIVEVLVNKGLIERCHSTDDRRRIDLELTDQGNLLLNSVFQQNKEWMQTRLATLSSEEIIELTKGLHVLKKAFE